MTILIHLVIVLFIILDIHAVHKRSYWKNWSFCNYTRLVGFPVLYISYCVVNYL